MGLLHIFTGESPLFPSLPPSSDVGLSDRREDSRNLDLDYLNLIYLLNPSFEWKSDLVAFHQKESFPLTSENKSTRPASQYVLGRGIGQECP